MYRLLILFMFSFLSCVNSKEVQVKQAKYSSYEEEVKDARRGNVGVTVVDSCEYVFMDNGYKGGCAIIHKQNCKFCTKKDGEDNNRN